MTQLVSALRVLSHRNPPLWMLRENGKTIRQVIAFCGLPDESVWDALGMSSSLSPEP